ncbi:MAG TPA: hypothetical protein VGF79_10745 [Bacteroidia bacterium]
MKRQYSLLLMPLMFLLLILFVNAMSKHFSIKETLLEKCLSIQHTPFNQSFYQMNYKDQKRKLYHSMEPGQTYMRYYEGRIVWTSNAYVKYAPIDQTKTNIKVTQVEGNDVLVRYELNAVMDKVNEKEWIAELAEAGRYNPKVFIDHIQKHNNEIKITENGNVFEYNNPNFKIQIHVDGTTARVKKVNFICPLTFNGLFGDEITTYEYYDYAVAPGGLNYPRMTVVSKDIVNTKDTVKIEDIQLLKNFSLPLKKPEAYNYKTDPIDDVLNLTVDTFSEHIKFITVENIGSRSIVVEFNDHVLVGEAPLSSRIGEAIIQKVKELHPDKPIKYFVFSHYHNWYTGGIRAFVHKGVEIICYDSISNYIGHIIQRGRMIEPDSLAIRNRDMKLKIRNGDLILKDGQYEMQILHVGRKSVHTIDYSVYYFPKEQFLFDGDNLWFKKDKPIEKAGKRAIQFYDFIKSKNIEVKTMAQSWPVDTVYNLKKFVDFKEFEQSVLMAR